MNWISMLGMFLVGLGIGALLAWYIVNKWDEELIASFKRALEMDKALIDSDDGVIKSQNEYIRILENENDNKIRS